ncbi:MULTISPECIES: hypothetical protein [Parachlamydia]|jgi:hypothetical protein|uniref:Uncharacterized protein n=2 Tax=Parachlamydia acanthamoebae TaxID=83552 RepID=F8KYV5_PARAV|nr:hypothetical protein [Parachlamydia acanthamoebae]EFB41061.1 hypothetical protein pah_c050o009 [Parachlamydia acanthamoebae str. Hall's coccus]KIA78220.1 hypothetical protein DB43_EL00310 [Parachlamydia acanthamoebae]CCB86070.1 putative uncharacterized protein [Parachlamydia acanthamoebae UV-7]
MMAGLFLFYSIALGAIALKQRILAISFIILGIFLSLLMLWHLATDTLKINW